MLHNPTRGIKAYVISTFTRTTIMFYAILLVSSAFAAYFLTDGVSEFFRVFKFFAVLFIGFPLSLFALFGLPYAVWFTLIENDVRAKTYAIGTSVLMIIAFMVIGGYSTIEHLEFTKKTEGAVNSSFFPVLSAHEECNTTYMSDYYYDGDSVVVRCGTPFWPFYKEIVLEGQDYKAWSASINHLEKTGTKIPLDLIR